MFLAFVILSVNQLVVLRDQSVPLCVASAYLKQFFFLAAFNFMTVICVDTAVSATALRVSTSRDKEFYVLGRYKVKFYFRFSRIHMSLYHMTLFSSEVAGIISSATRG